MPSGNSYQDVINHLTKQGYKTRQGKKFSHSTLNSLLRNEKYYGTYIYNREGGKRKAKRVLIERFDEVRNETAIPAIITKAQFDKVQAILNSRKSCRPHQNANPEYFLTGFVVCKSCGSSMSGLSNRGGKMKTLVRTYACPNHGVKRDKTCKTKSINAKYLETAIKNILADKVNAYLSAPNTQKSVFDLLRSSKVEEVKNTQKRIKSLDDYINGLIAKAVNPKTSKAVAQRCDEQANEAIEAQAQHKARLVELQEMLSHVDEIEAAFAAKTECLTVDDIFKSYAIAREIVGLFVEKIVVDDTNDDIEIILKD